MKKLFLLVFLSFGVLGLSAQTVSPKYNQALADSLGADAYGMKSYVLVILKTGPAQVDEPARVSEIFRGHLDNIGCLSEAGKLIIAGPLAKNERSYRGIYIFDVKTVAEAEALLLTDPAIESKLLEAEIYSWYGSAALPVYLEVHEKIERERP